MKWLFILGGVGVVLYLVYRSRGSGSSAAPPTAIGLARQIGGLRNVWQSPTQLSWIPRNVAATDPNAPLAGGVTVAPATPLPTYDTNPRTWAQH